MDPARPIPPPSALAASANLPATQAGGLESPAASAPGALAASANRPATQAGELASPAASARVGYFRWVICALLLFGVTKNYMDRQLLGVLKTTLQHDFRWNDIQYGHLVSYFQLSYAARLPLARRTLDR